MNRLHSNKEYKEQLIKRHSSPEYRERLWEYSLARSHKVEVFDTLTNQTTVYISISEAARAIGCVKGTIVLAIKFLKEKGVPRLIKKRYLVKPIEDKP